MFGRSIAINVIDAVRALPCKFIIEPTPMLALSIDISKTLPCFAMIATKQRIVEKDFKWRIFGLSNQIDFGEGNLMP